MRTPMKHAWAELERMVGRLTMENDLLKKLLAEAKRSDISEQRKQRCSTVMFLRSQLEERPTAERAIRELGEASVSRVRLSIAISSMIISGESQ